MKTNDSRTLARVFVTLLRYELTADEFKEVRRRNAVETDPRVCHSHDFRDSNMIMLDALKAVCPTVAYNSDMGTAIWNAAWEHAMSALGRKRKRKA